MITRQQPYPHKENDSKQQPHQIHENNKQEEQNRNCYDCIKGVYCCKWWQSTQSNKTQKDTGCIRNYHNNKKISIIKAISDNKLTVNTMGRLTTQQSNDIKNIDDRDENDDRDKDDKNDDKNNDRDKQLYISNNTQKIDNNNYDINIYNNYGINSYNNYDIKTSYNYDIKTSYNYEINTYNNKNAHNIYQQKYQFDNHNNNRHNYSSYKGKTKQLLGIRNLGNTCYMNSVLQCLLNLEEFNKDLQKFLSKLKYLQEKIGQQKESQQLYYKRQEQESSQYKGRTNIAREYLKILQKCYQEQFYTKILNVIDLREAIIQSTSQKGHYNNKFHLYKQQDAHQFATCLLDFINKQLQQLSLEKPSLLPSSLLETQTRKGKQLQKQPQETIINKHFQVQTLSVIECKSCSHKQSVVGKSLGLTVDVNVDVDANNNQSNKYINKFNSGQYRHQIYHPQLYYQQYQPQSFPSVQQLVQNQWNPNNKCIQIQNYHCAYCNQQTTIKNTQSLYHLPKVIIIQLKRFVQNSCNQKVEKDTSIVNVSQYLDFTHLISKQSNRQNKNNKNANDKCIYKLSSIANHYGSTKSGHYTAHVHKQNLNQWYIVNDTIVDKINFQSSSQSAYLLFYQKIQNQQLIK